MFEDALRARDQTISYLRKTIQDSADAVQEAVNVLGIPEGEEVKEETDDKLSRLANQITAEAHQGTLVYRKPDQDQEIVKQLDVNDHYFPIRKLLVKYNSKDGYREIYTPHIDYENWYSSFKIFFKLREIN